MSHSTTGSARTRVGDHDEFRRTIPDMLRHRGRFRTNHSETFGTADDDRTDQYEQESAQIQRESHVEGILNRLDARERQVVTDSFGLTRGQEPLTLKQVGVVLGVTKERVRQLQCRAMGKLRIAARDSIE